MSQDPVGIIGGGLGGLAAACILAARGYPVVLWEKNDRLGGQTAGLSARGFTFDTGPTQLTLPRVLHRIFAESGRATADWLDLRRLDPQWRGFFQDGSSLDLLEDGAAMAAQLREHAPGTASRYRDFMDMSARMHEIIGRRMFWRSVESPAEALDLRQGIDRDTLRDAVQLRLGATLAGQVGRMAEDPRVAQMLQQFAYPIGSSPYLSPAMLAGLAHMQTQDGLWYPMGGLRAVSRALELLARELGVDFRLGLAVRRIVTAGGRVRGAETADGRITPLRAVVSNLDAVATYRELVGGAAEKTFSRRFRRDASCSGVLLCLGLNRAYPHLAHHNFVFSRNPEAEYHYIHDLGEPAPDPTCHVAAPARTDPACAPAGGEALHVLVQVPYLRPRHDWASMLPAYRRIILDKLKRSAGMPDLEDRIVFEHVQTPQDLQDRYGVPGGALYGLSSHGRLAGAFKPANRSRDLPGLYLAGAGAHPGPLVAMVLMSGWIAADALDADMGKTPYIPS